MSQSISVFLHEGLTIIRTQTQGFFQLFIQDKFQRCCYLFVRDLLIDALAYVWPGASQSDCKSSVFDAVGGRSLVEVERSINHVLVAININSQMIRCYRAIFTFTSPLIALSPLDGRYQSKAAPLAPYFSESALMRYRIIVQCQWLLHMIQNKIIPQQKGVSTTDLQVKLNSMSSSFDVASAQKVKQIQRTTNHDLKSVEYFIKQNLDHYKEHIHFCCTSEDINNLAYALMLKKAIGEVYLPSAKNILETLMAKAVEWSEHPMLAHTHGQPATPTTLGKQYANFSYRLAEQLSYLKKVKIYGKFNGAVGNYNSHYFTYPHLDWPEISRSFVEQRLALTFNPYTTQIESHDSLCRVFTEVSAFNTILIGLCRDTWEYISKGYLIQKTKEGEVGSSTMPHKVNPIDFQNAEGNLGIANSLADHFRNKLPISRQQRDLSDSTVLRNQGTILGYSLIAYDSLGKGLQKINSNESYMKKELGHHLEVITEAIQTELRKVGYPEPYELLKKLSRGKSFNQEVRSALLLELKGKIPDDSYQKIKAITPEKYLGRAVDLAKNIRNACKEF